VPMHPSGSPTTHGGATAEPEARTRPVPPRAQPAKPAAQPKRPTGRPHRPGAESATHAGAWLDNALRADDTATQDLTWVRPARRPHQADQDAPALRLPGPYDPAPDSRRMVGICAWAAVLGVIGTAIALRALAALITAAPPGWYEPTVVAVGVLGMALTAAAYLAVHHTWLPWALLGAATVPLAANLTATIVAL